MTTHIFYVFITSFYDSNYLPYCLSTTLSWFSQSLFAVCFLCSSHNRFKYSVGFSKFHFLNSHKATSIHHLHMHMTGIHPITAILKMSQTTLSTTSVQAPILVDVPRSFLTPLKVKTANLSLKYSLITRLLITNKSSLPKSCSRTTIRGYHSLSNASAVFIIFPIAYLLSVVFTTTDGH